MLSLNIKNIELTTFNLFSLSSLISELSLESRGLTNEKKSNPVIKNTNIDIIKSLKLTKINREVTLKNMIDSFINCNDFASSLQMSDGL